MRRINCALPSPEPPDILNEIWEQADNHGPGLQRLLDVGGQEGSFMLPGTAWPLGWWNEMLQRLPCSLPPYLWHLIFAFTEEWPQRRHWEEGGCGSAVDREGSYLIPSSRKSSALVIKGSSSNPTSQQRDLISWGVRSTHCCRVISWFNLSRFLQIEWLSASLCLGF